MGRVVLETRNRTVTGTVKLPNGVWKVIDYPGDFEIVDPTGQASATISLDICGYSIGFSSNTGMGYGWYPGGYPSVAASIHGGFSGTGGGETATIDLSDTTDYGGRTPGQDYITGTFSVSGEAELCLYTEGKDLSDIESPTPDDNYPTYGGARVVGEFPEVNAKLIWEWAGPPKTGTITFGGQSASITNEHATITDGVGFGMSLIDDSFYDSHGVDLELSWDGIPVEAPTMYKRYYGGHDCSAGDEFSGGVEVATGLVRVRNRGYMRCSTLSACAVGISGTMYIPRFGDFQADAMAMDHPHPHACHWTLLHKWKTILDGGDIRKEPVYVDLIGQSVSFDIKQNKLLINQINLENKAINRVDQSDNWLPGCGMWPPGAAAQIRICFEHCVDETGPIRFWITPPPGENSKDWRVGFRGKQFNAFTVNHASTLTVSLPSLTHTGDDYTGTFSPPQVWEGYRFARVTGTAKRISINGKSWTLSAPSTIIDLCVPDNTSTKADGTHTRYPLDRLGRSQTESGLWGITQATSLAAFGGTVTGIQLMTQEHAKNHFLEPMQDWLELHEPDQVGDYDVEYYVQRCGIGDVDGRQSYECYDVLKTVNNAPGRRYSDDYTHYSLAHMATQIASMPGYSTTLGTALDDYHSPTNGSAWWAGQGFTKSGGSWTKGWDSTGTVKAQPIFDGMEWSDLCGDVFGVGSGSSYALGLTGRKVYRGSAYGLVMNGGKGKRAEPFDDPLARITASDNDGSHSISTTADNQIGYYEGGPTLTNPNAWGKVQAHWDGIEPVWDSPSLGVGGIPRMINRAAFAYWIAVLSGSIAYDVALHGRHVVAYTDSGKAKLKLSANNAHQTFKDVETDIDCSALSVRWTKGANQRLALMYVDLDNAIQLAYSTDEGMSWSMPTLISPSGITCAFIVSNHGTRYIYWIEDDGSTVKIRGQVRDANDKVIIPSFDVVSNVDRTGLAVDESYGDGSSHRITLIYSVDGTITSMVSSNGREFT